MFAFAIVLALFGTLEPKTRPSPPSTDETLYMMVAETAPTDAAHRQKVFDALDARMPAGEEKSFLYRWTIRVPDSTCPNGLVHVMLGRNGWGVTWLFASSCNTASQEALLTLAEERLDAAMVPTSPLIP